MTIKKTLETRNFKEREIYSATEYILVIPLKLGSGKIYIRHEIQIQFSCFNLVLMEFHEFFNTKQMQIYRSCSGEKMHKMLDKS